MQNDSDKTKSNETKSGNTMQLLIRKIIFEQFNDPDLRFTNDEIFEILKENFKSALNDDISDVCDLESDFDSLCESGMIRNIAQNFNTMWFKLFDVVEEIHQCSGCSKTIHLSKSETRRCPDVLCMSSIT